VYCIFDTGCSGMVVSPSLLDARYDDARANREKSLWGGGRRRIRDGFGGHRIVARGPSHYHAPWERRSAMGEIVGRARDSGAGLGILRGGNDDGGYRWG
jgi:hypothetical protein